VKLLKIQKNAANKQMITLASSRKNPNKTNSITKLSEHELALIRSYLY